MNLKKLIGSGDRIMLLTLPFLIVGLALNILRPSWFDVSGAPEFLQPLSIIILLPGIILWLWSVTLILIKVPKQELITSGPYALVKHPLYTSVALLVLPWIGFLLNSWLGVLLGAVLYIASRVFSPEEETALYSAFGPAWEAYQEKVKIPWL
jgi:protein-S-isoprenylcysteine O-methyltransferase Ste14